MIFNCIKCLYFESSYSLTQIYNHPIHIKKYHSLFYRNPRLSRSYKFPYSMVYTSRLGIKHILSYFPLLCPNEE